MANDSARPLTQAAGGAMRQMPELCSTTGLRCDRSIEGGMVGNVREGGLMTAQREAGALPRGRQAQQTVLAQREPPDAQGRPACRPADVKTRRLHLP